jgi:hypothetical protein
MQPQAREVQLRLLLATKEMRSLSLFTPDSLSRIASSLDAE